MPYARTGRCVALAIPLFAALVASAFGQPAEPGRHFALLVGVKKYADDELASLKYTENDVTELAAVLKAAGYRRVVVLTQSEAFKAQDRTLFPTGENIRRHLDALLKNRQRGDSVVVAFAGHGVQPKGATGLSFCPEDARLADAKTLVPLTDVYTALQDCKAGVKVLLADACRNDPLTGRSGRPAVEVESLTRPALPMPPGGVVGLFSCSQGQKAFESDALKHGFLFHAVIEGLKGKAADAKGDIDLLGLARYAINEVPEAVKDQVGPLADQVPELIGQVRGRVMLVQTAAPAAPVAKAPAPRPAPPQLSQSQLSQRPSNQAYLDMLSALFSATKDANRETIDIMIWFVARPDADDLKAAAELAGALKANNGQVAAVVAEDRTLDSMTGELTTGKVKVYSDPRVALERKDIDVVIAFGLLKAAQVPTFFHNKTGLPRNLDDAANAFVTDCCSRGKDSFVVITRSDRAAWQPAGDGGNPAVQAAAQYRRVAWLGRDGANDFSGFFGAVRSRNLSGGGSVSSAPTNK